MTPYVAQRLHAFTNLTCDALLCYRRAGFVILRSGSPLDVVLCEECAKEKLKACATLAMIEAAVVAEQVAA